MTTEQKLEKLKHILQDMKTVIVAYSGGVDSTFLLKIAYDVLKEKARGVLAVSPTFPSREYEKAIQLANEIGAEIEIVETQETEMEDFLKNPENRCYFCKGELFTKIGDIADTLENAVMVDGSNHDDLSDYRPGMKALKEKGIRSPLREAQLTKKEIRELSKKIGLPTWDKDALACLSSRFPYGERIDIKRLKMIDEAENFLNDLGLRQVRARNTGNTIKIEVLPDQIKMFFDDAFRQKVVKRLKDIGYTYVTIDLEGYRQGSLNEELNSRK